MRGTTANVYGSSVELSGGTLLNRVRMMQNLAEMYGSVTVAATSGGTADGIVMFAPLGQVMLCLAAQ